VPAPLRALALLALALVALVGCQMDVAIEVDVADDGSGAVLVAVGLDDQALAEAGDLGQLLRTDDLVAAGWAVTGPEREGDRTWVRATKPFADPDQAAQVLAEVTGPGGALQGFALEVDDGLLGTSYELTGVVDLTGGPATFSDPDLAAALDGDPFGGLLDDVAEAQGRPATELVDLTLTVDLPGAEPVVLQPSFADAEPTEVDVSSSTGGLFQPWLLAIGVAVLLALVLAAVLAVVVLRQGGRRRPPPGRYAAPRR
jgi:hypothetical protein